MITYKQVLDFDVPCPRCIGGENPMIWIRPESHDDEAELLPMFHVCSYCHLLLQDGVGKIRSFSTAKFSEHRYCYCGERVAQVDRCSYCVYAQNIHKDTPIALSGTSPKLQEQERNLGEEGQVV